MSLFKRLFGKPRPAPSAQLAALRTRLESFVRPAMALVDPRQLTIPAQRERYAVFVYGAASTLAGSRDLGETEALALVVMFLRASAAPRFPEQEVSHLVGRAMALAGEPEGRATFERGAEAMGEWLAGDSGGAVGRLAQTLRAPP
jgi:hypothetical protein